MLDFKENMRAFKDMEDKLTCVSCRKLAKELVEPICGDLICEGCFKLIVASRCKPKECPKCLSKYTSCRNMMSNMSYILNVIRDLCVKLATTITDIGNFLNDDLPEGPNHKPKCNIMADQSQHKVKNGLDVPQNSFNKLTSTQTKGVDMPNSKGIPSVSRGTCSYYAPKKHYMPVNSCESSTECDLDPPEKRTNTEPADAKHLKPVTTTEPNHNQRTTPIIESVKPFKDNGYFLNDDLPKGPDHKPKCNIMADQSQRKVKNGLDVPQNSFNKLTSTQTKGVDMPDDSKGIASVSRGIKWYYAPKKHFTPINSCESSNESDLDPPETVTNTGPDPKHLKPVTTAVPDHIQPAMPIIESVKPVKDNLNFLNDDLPEGPAHKPKCNIMADQSQRKAKNGLDVPQNSFNKLTSTQTKGVDMPDSQGIASVSRGTKWYYAPKKHYMPVNSCESSNESYLDPPETVTNTEPDPKHLKSVTTAVPDHIQPAMPIIESVKPFTDKGNFLDEDIITALIIVTEDLITADQSQHKAKNGLDVPQNSFNKLTSTQTKYIKVVDMPDSKRIPSVSRGTYSYYAPKKHYTPIESCESSNESDLDPPETVTSTEPDPKHLKPVTTTEPDHNQPATLIIESVKPFKGKYQKTVTKAFLKRHLKRQDKGNSNPVSADMDMPDSKVMPSVSRVSNSYIASKNHCMPIESSESSTKPDLDLSKPSPESVEPYKGKFQKSLAKAFLKRNLKRQAEANNHSVGSERSQEVVKNVALDPQSCMTAEISDQVALDEVCAGEISYEATLDETCTAAEISHQEGNDHPCKRPLQLTSVAQHETFKLDIFDSGCVKKINISDKRKRKRLDGTDSKPGECPTKRSKDNGNSLLNIHKEPCTNKISNKIDNAKAGDSLVQCSSESNLSSLITKYKIDRVHSEPFVKIHPLKLNDKCIPVEHKKKKVCAKLQGIPNRAGFKEKYKVPFYYLGPLHRAVEKNAGSIDDYYCICGTNKCECNVKREASNNLDLTNGSDQQLGHISAQVSKKHNKYKRILPISYSTDSDSD